MGLWPTMSHLAYTMLGHSPKQTFAAQPLLASLVCLSSKTLLWEARPHPINTYYFNACANDMLNPSQMTRLCVPSSVYQGLWCVLVTCGPSCHTWHVSCQAPAQKAFAAQHMLSIPGVSSKQDLILGSQAPPKTHTRYECMC